MENFPMYELNGRIRLAQHMNLLHVIYPFGGLWALSSYDGTNTSSKGIPCLTQIRWRASFIILEAMESVGSSIITASSRVLGAGSTTSSGRMGTTEEKSNYRLGLSGCSKWWLEDRISDLVAEFDSTIGLSCLEDDLAGVAARHPERLEPIAIKLSKNHD